MAFPPLFAAHAAYAERVKAAMLYCCDLSPPSRKPAVRRQPYPRGVSQTHDIVIPQHSQKRFCRKIFCEEERRAFQAYRSGHPNGRIRRSAVTTSVQKEIRELFYCQSQTLTHLARNSCSSGLPLTDCDAATMGRMRWTYWIAVSVLVQKRFRYFSASSSLPCSLKMR